MAGSIVVFRPGALGDVVVCRHLLCWLRAAFPAARLVFVAPGERGRLPGAFGLADGTADWESAAFAWLFSRGGGEAPAALRRVFAPRASAVLAFLDMEGDDRDAFRDRVAAVAPGARILIAASRPPAGAGMYIGTWLTERAALFFGKDVPAGSGAGGAGFTARGGVERDGAMLAIHPGSGSAGKNWPLPSFAAFAALAAREREEGGLGIRRVRVVSGEADGALGEELAARVPGAESIRGLSLVDLTRLLAGAGYFLGNDSGPAHLAAAARTEKGERPVTGVLFGPGDPRVWAAPGTVALDAGKGMDRLPAERAYALFRAFSE